MKNEKSKVALLSVFAAIFLTGLKLIVALITGSLGLMSEALHSGLDLVAAIITFFSVRISDRPADKKHNFGHGKVENFSAFIETILLVITCGWIIYEALNRLISGNTHIEVSIWSYVVVLISIVVDISRSKALYKVAKKHNSQALEADALHFSTDIWSSGVVLLGLICAQFGFYVADSIAALGVAIIVLFVSYKLGSKAVDVLLDRAPESTIDQVSAILMETPEVLRFHDLKIRISGADTFVNVTIHVNPEISVWAAHDISELVEKKISQTIPRSEIQVHYEPDDK